MSESAIAIYAGTIAFIALISILAVKPSRRRDARTTLGLLLRRRGR